eukprot:CAMPEP_0202108848 /NCGR_PEP_ID=MMETSP0965-20130614/22197_1 /ASSEMBLY_ACC=CAM_ASM_000507 /TAXON_ID=4773 /ORGANISM="Schizochytrium aggregatum, Strain ATCC28209" /LENGTH=43 /DNA_ID= /DNA_START= /DNA_END= /DNA_ORIENTATION=
MAGPSCSRSGPAYMNVVSSAAAAAFAILRETDRTAQTRGDAAT